MAIGIEMKNKYQLFKEKRFLTSRRTGFYFRVLQEGKVGAGDTLELVSRDDNKIAVADITQLYVREEHNPELLHRAAQLEALPKSWRDYFSALK
ncbi:MAG: 3-alpha domain-containing protein [Nostoc sp. DedQUE12a]|nr:3-alpha domain-containing protein [Nostoc sp. DedQUE12a]